MNDPLEVFDALAILKFHLVHKSIKLVACQWTNVSAAYKRCEVNERRKVESNDHADGLFFQDGANNSESFTFPSQSWHD